MNKPRKPGNGEALKQLQKAYREIAAPTGFARRVAAVAEERRRPRFNIRWVAATAAVALLLLLIIPLLHVREEPQNGAGIYPGMAGLTEVSGWLSAQGGLDVPHLSDISSPALLPDHRDLDEQPTRPAAQPPRSGTQHPDGFIYALINSRGEYT